MAAKQLWVWMDMEMSGLNPETDVILEWSTVITDIHLEIVASCETFVIQQRPELFQTMDDWNQTHHSKSGLWQQVLDSKTTLQEANDKTLAFLKKHTAVKSSPLCGNSIWQDRRFIVKYLPEIEQHLHYRLIDVSTLKELYKNWYPKGPEFSKKESKHRALDDILESIEELKFYQKQIFVPIT